MNPTVYREACGTHRGLILHQSAGEEPCGACRLGEQLRRLQAEAIPDRPPARERWAPSTVTDALPPVSAEQAAANRRLLGAELGEYERNRSHLRLVQAPPEEGAA